MTPNVDAMISIKVMKPYLFIDFSNGFVFLFPFFFTNLYRELSHHQSHRLSCHLNNYYCSHSQL